MKNTRLKAPSQAGGYSADTGYELVMTASLSPHNPSPGSYRRAAQKAHQDPRKVLHPLLKTSPASLVRGKLPQRWVCCIPSPRLCLPGQEVKWIAKEKSWAHEDSQAFVGG